LNETTPNRTTGRDELEGKFVLPTTTE
jgi:hypothetical protein